jgi:hypothetical protein
MWEVDTSEKARAAARRRIAERENLRPAREWSERSNAAYFQSVRHTGSPEPASAPSGLRTLVALDPLNIRREPVTSPSSGADDQDRLIARIRQYQAERGIKTFTQAASEYCTLHPDEAQAHRDHLHAAVDRTAQVAGAAREFDARVEQYRRDHPKADYATALCAVANANRELAEARRVELSVPIINGVAMTAV